MITQISESDWVGVDKAKLCTKENGGRDKRYA